MAVWVKLMTSIHDHPKAIEAGHQSMWIWVSMLCHAKERDTSGFVHASFVHHSRFGRAPLRAVSRLVDVGLLHEVEGGWQIDKFEEKQGETASISEVRAKKAAQKRKERAAKRADVASDTPEPVARLEQSRAEQSRKEERELATSLSSSTSSSVPIRQPVVAREGVERVTAVWNRFPAKRRNLTDVQTFDALERVTDVDAATLDRLENALTEDLGSAEWQREDGRYVPSLLDWIAQRRWDRAPTLERDRLATLASSDHAADRAVARWLAPTMEAEK